jgi:glycine betaine/proline transport system ATP-binding protein
MISQDSLIEKVKNKSPHPYREAFLSDIVPIDASEPLSNVLGRVAESRWPVPVVDEKNRYVGAISKSALLETLDRAG